jgi:hypothetical protein
MVKRVAVARCHCAAKGGSQDDAARNSVLVVFSLEDALMFGFLTRGQRPKRHIPRVAPRARLNVEALEQRYCLSTPSVPSLTFNAQALPGHAVQLSGSVTDAKPSSVSISFSGAAAGSTYADAKGNYSYVTSQASLGQVSATATDGQGLTSNTATATISVPMPTITIGLTYGTGRTVTLSGAVTDLDAASLTVTFTGVVSGSTPTGTGGSFSFTAQATGLGTVTATVVNLWGEQSNPANISVSPAAPVVSQFQAVEQDGPLHYFTFSGTVSDSSQSSAGDWVTLGGSASISGKKAQVQSDGTWSITIQMQANENCTATAQAQDAWGQLSAIVTDPVYVT